MCLLSTGNIMPLSLAAADALHCKGVSTRVESFHTVKPLAGKRLEELFHSYRTIVTVEEHSLVGGLGSAVAEWMADQNVQGRRLLRFGTADAFIDELGSQDYMRRCCGLSPEAVADRVLRALDTSRREISK